jgi:enamine deaminase RidA (YjgF/YER057c/UK114 family)
MSAEARVRELGLTIPEAPAAVAAYVPTVVAGRFVYVSGQIPARAGGLPRTGSVGADLTVEDAAEEARYCALNLLAQLRAAAGTLDAIERIVRLTVFVASAPGFRSQPAVANGASELLVEVFGHAGQHTRSAVGVAELPLGAPVEVDAIALLRE